MTKSKLGRRRWYTDRLLVSAPTFGERYHGIRVVLNAGPVRWVGRLSESLSVGHERAAYFLPNDKLSSWQQAVINLSVGFAVASVSY